MEIRSRKVLLPVILVFLSGCCMEVCTDAEIRGFQFENFSSSELDNAKLVKYPAGKLATPIDTIDLVMPISNSATFTGTGPLLFNYDYRILLNNNSTYTISNIVTRNEECNCRNWTFKVMNSYQVNGQLRINDSNEIIRIIK